MESELLALLHNAKPNRDKLHELIKGLEAAASIDLSDACLLYTSPSPRDLSTSRMPSSA